MVDLRNMLGQRIVEAARLAAAMHLRHEQDQQKRRQQEPTGGAGPRHSTDGDLTATNGRLPRLPFTAEGEAA